jgi:Uma2 family endonuclease
MPTVATKLTVADYAKAARPTGGWWELRHGELIHVTFPSSLLYKLQDRLVTLLRAAAGSGWFIGLEIAFRPAPEHELWAADVAAVASARWDDAGEDWLSGSPELVIEVLSPSNTASEMLDREQTCFRGGCLEFWVVDPSLRLVRISRQDGSSIACAEDDEIPLALLGGGCFAVSALFAV